jgi:hypothetical protein
MAESTKDAGTIQVMLERLNNERLPQALELEKKVNRGECLDDYELRFLQQVFEDASTNQFLLGKHPEYQALVSRLAGLYSDITRKALENEEKAHPAAGGRP